MSGSNGSGFVQLRRAIHDGEHRSKLPPTRFAAYIHLILDAETDTGVVHTSAGSLVSSYGFTERAARDAMERLEGDGYIRRFHVRGRRGEYPVLVNNYKVTTGAMKGAKLNAAKSVSLDELAYDSRDDDVDDSVNDDVNENGELGAMIVPPYKGSKKEKEKEKENSSSSVPPGQNGNFQLSPAPMNSRKNGHSKDADFKTLIENFIPFYRETLQRGRYDLSVLFTPKGAKKQITRLQFLIERIKGIYELIRRENPEFDHATLLANTEQAMQHIVRSFAGDDFMMGREAPDRYRGKPRKYNGLAEYVLKSQERIESALEEEA